MFLHIEFMYKPRPNHERARTTFDTNVRGRLGVLSAADTLLMICDSEATIDSLKPVLDEFQHLPTEYLIANPQPRSTQTDTPVRCGWEAPDTWRQMDMSDRWARILAALQRAAELGGEGYLIMPAHEVSYDSALPCSLMTLSRQKTLEDGRRYAVSPRSPLPFFPWQPTLGDSHAVNLHTAAFDRVPLDMVCDGGQGFWGKMGMIPFALCRPLFEVVDTKTWEDDLEMDQAVHALGHATVCLNVGRARYAEHYDHLTTDVVRQIITRHLHYSLKIPGERPSALQAEPTRRSLRRAGRYPHYARALEAADALIAECDAEMRARVAQYGCSWVDWGAYRYVARPRDPAVEVWKRA